VTDRTLVITNDFPPRTGGIQSYVYALASLLPADSVVVYTSIHPGAAAYDAGAPFPVVRSRSRLLLPTAAVGRRAAEIVRSEGCNSVWFGAAAPLGLLTGGLRRAGVRRVVASTHGHETGWARLPAARSLLRRISRDVDVLTCIAEFTRRGLAPAMAPGARVVRLSPGVDTDLFHPGVDGTAVRAAYALDSRPTVVCVSRLVRRKGQDALIAALPIVRASVPDVALLLVGGGPDRARLQRLAARAGVSEAVRFSGEVRWDALPSYYAAGDVFAMPCRTRRGGLDVEGFGMVYVEAAATGLPVVAGNSGGAPEAVLDGRTGYVVHDPLSPPAIARRLIPLLTDPARAAALGAAGREWVLRELRWDLLANRLAGLLGPAG